MLFEYSDAEYEIHYFDDNEPDPEGLVAAEQLQEMGSDESDSSENERSVDHDEPSPAITESCSSECC